MIIRPDKHHRIIESQRELCTIKTACAYMNVSRRTIYNWIKNGDIDWCKTPVGFVRIYVDSLTKEPYDKLVP